jgi:hypothetical protein
MLSDKVLLADSEVRIRETEHLQIVSHNIVDRIGAAVPPRASDPTQNSLILELAHPLGVLHW